VNANEELITKFYTAFQQQDAATMASCYHQNIVFSDPVFPSLHGQSAVGMWYMLCARAQDFSLVFSEVTANETEGSAHWIATYTFSQTGRTVVNDIRATFAFAEGKIIQHRDDFDLWRWARQALGFKGLLLKVCNTTYPK
jgi:ketosteroid isomerase-like protein